VSTGRTVHYWKIADDATLLPSPPGDRGCPANMAAVDGTMKQGAVELNQDSVCDDWMDPPKKFPRRCARFNQDKWEKIAEKLPGKRVKPFCIDKYEYPNVRGGYPAIDLNWYEAKALCEKEGKRLCTEDEWTFACEGEKALPYPYGYVMSRETCNIQKPWLDFGKEHLSPRSEAAEGLAHLWQGEPSGSRPDCVSPFGVYDMTGNVDEWTSSVTREGYRSILKGGYWSVVRNRCRPSTRAHNEGHQFYQQGFRCCL
jgi:formylglycine-generating enzyme required for sulfatase activity